MPSRANAAGLRRAALAVALLAGATLVVALTLPTVTFRKLGSPEETYSIWGGIEVLYEDGNWILGTIVFLFSIVFPSAKLVALVGLWWRGSLQEDRTYLDWLRLLGKWSFLDVLIVGLFVGSIRIGIATAHSHPGIHVFGLAIVLSMVASELAARAVGGGRRMGAPRPGALDRVVVAVAAVAFGVAVATTLFVVKKAVFWSNRVGLAPITEELATGGERLLAAAFGVLVLAVPGARLLASLRLRFLPRPTLRAARVAMRCDEWSLVGVLGLALVIVHVKLDELATADLGVGFHAAIVAGVAAEVDAWLVRRGARRAAGGG